MLVKPSYNSREVVLSSTEDGRTTSGRRTQPSEGVRLSTWTGIGGGREQKSTKTVKQSAIGAHPPYYPYVGGVGAPLTLPPSPSPSYEED
jgi:hypothetical protein